MPFPDFIRIGGTPIGTPEDFAPGSQDRAKVLALHLLMAWDEDVTTGRDWEMEVRRARREATHTRLGFRTFDAFLQALIGSTETQARTRFGPQVAAQRVRNDADRGAKRLLRIQKELPKLTSAEVAELRQSLELLQR